MSTDYSNLTTPQQVSTHLCGQDYENITDLGVDIGILIISLQVGSLMLVVAYAGFGFFHRYWRFNAPTDLPPERTSIAATKSMRNLLQHRTSNNVNNEQSDMLEDGEAGSPIYDKLQRVCISTINLDYKVKSLVQTSYLRSKLPGNKPEMHQILHGVTCTFRPGNLTAIMGPSGCGKTTLLNLAAGQTAMGEVSGIRAINGHPIESPRTYRKAMQRIAGYMQQVDVQFEELSVEETLYFTGRLVLSSKTPKELCKSVYDAMVAMDLLAARNAPVGGTTFAGISGGQRRRLSLAQQLLDGPPVIIADEPTSGLDATSSLNIVIKLSEMAKLGHTVMLTIHQPRQEIIDLFDRLLLLVEGRTAFMGPVEDAAAFFDASGLPSKPLKQFTNVGDFIGDAVDEEKSRLRKKKAEQTLTKLWSAQETGVVEYLMMKDNTGVDAAADERVVAFETSLKAVSDSPRPVRFSKRPSSISSSNSIVLPTLHDNDDVRALGSTTLPEDFSEMGRLLKSCSSSDQYTVSSEANATRAEFETLLVNGRKSAPFFSEVTTVAWRALYRSWFGSWKYCAAYILQVGVTSVVLWWAFRATREETRPKNIYDANNPSFVSYLTAVTYQAYFAILYCCSVQYLFIVPITFSERIVFKHESSAGQQTSLVHVISLAISDSVPAILAIVPVYFIVFFTFMQDSNYESPQSGALFFMISTGVFAFDATVGLVCQLATTPDAAFTLMFLVLAGGGLFSGTIISYPYLGFWKWIYFGDPVSWISRAVVINVLGYSFVFTTCATGIGQLFETLFPFPSGDDSSVSDAGLVSYCQERGLQPDEPLNVGVALVEYFGFDDKCFSTNFWVLAVFFFAARLLCSAVIRIRIATSFGLRQVKGAPPRWSKVATA